MIYYSSCLNLLPGKPHIFSLIFLLMNSNHVSTVSNHSLPFPFLWQYKQTINQLREKIPCIQRTRQEMINFCFQQVKHVQISKDTLHYIFFCFRPRKMMSIFVFTVAVTILFTSVNSALIHKSKVSLRHPVFGDILIIYHRWLMQVILFWEKWHWLAWIKCLGAGPFRVI